MSINLRAKLRERLLNAATTDSHRPAPAVTLLAPEHARNMGLSQRDFIDMPAIEEAEILAYLESDAFSDLSASENSSIISCSTRTGDDKNNNNEDGDMGVPVQMGFLMDDAPVVDRDTGKPVPWAVYDDELIREISEAPWKVVDVETTGLTPSSLPVSMSPKEFREGWDINLRLRIVSILHPMKGGGIRKLSFDLDKYRQHPSERHKIADICAAALRRAFIAHNAGFDLYWLRYETRKAGLDILPDLVIDTMLHGRVLAPEVPLQLVELAEGYDPADLKNQVADDDRAKLAYEAIMGKRSGWSLGDLSMVRLNKILPKDLQGPKNWAIPHLSMKHYEYAIDDVQTDWDLLCHLYGMGENDDPIARYQELKTQYPEFECIEPQVMDVVLMREHGMPMNKESAATYVEVGFQRAREEARKMVEIEPALAPFEEKLADAGSGVTKDVKAALGEAFRQRGVDVAVTDNGEDKIGEKDLRLAGAQSKKEALPLFEAWIGVAKNKKAASMAKDLIGFANRSAEFEDGLLHPLLAHGPVTGRLAAKEPNTQQFPRDPLFRAIIEAFPNCKILASDYSALDMRVGAALAVRAQREIREAYWGTRECPAEVRRVIEYVYDSEDKEALHPTLIQREADVMAEMQKLAKQRPPADGKSRKAFWQAKDIAKKTHTLARFAMRLCEVLIKADAAGTPEYSALRDAFVLGVDIHTYTAMGMNGINAKSEFEGKSHDEVEAHSKVWKKKLGDKRQNGKVGNLSLLYAMQAAGLVETAGKNYNIHWTLEEAQAILNQWLDAYPEIELWHLWTDLNPYDTVWMPDPDRGGKRVKKNVYKVKTLGGRTIYAFGLNAALAFQDQSSGADVLGMVMHDLRTRHPVIFDTAINQVHDEMVFHMQAVVADEYTVTVQDLMNECANRLLMPYGVPSSCSPALGDVWLKD